MYKSVLLKFVFWLILPAFLLSCTTARWTVKETGAVDRSESELLEQKQFLATDGVLSPDNPVLRLKVLSRTQLEYPRRVLMQRTIQDYRLRPGFVILGLAGASAAFYAANAPSLNKGGSNARSLSLNAAGTVLVLSAFLNMKPVGDERPTGEERYLRSTGSIVETDTVDVSGRASDTADIIVQYDGRILMRENEREILSGTLELQMANLLDDLQLSDSNPGEVNVQIEFNDSTHTYTYPVSDILLPYARITAPLTVLRNTPEETEGSVMAELLGGSQLPVDSIEDDRWYRVLYGTSENFILRSDAELIWRPSGFIDNNSVVTISEIPYGNIDVENNIPVLRNSRQNAYALIITNEGYGGEFSPRNYSHRDGRLLKNYLSDALGYRTENIFEIQDAEDSSEITQLIRKLAQTTNDSSEVFVFINGRGFVTNEQEKEHIYLATVSAEENLSTGVAVSLQTLCERLSKVPSGSMLVLNDISFDKETGIRNLSRSENRRILEENFSVLTNQKPGTAIIMGSGLDQPSGLYLSATGDDKKHHIFPYFFARALQRRITDLPAIYQFLERNVPYTSRRLHDQSQDPMLLGSTSLDFNSE